VRWGSDERGSGAVLSLAPVAALAAVVTILLPFALLMPVKHRVKDAADAAALAAADVAVGLVPGAPCEVAATVVEGNGAELADCRMDGPIATVTAAATVAGVPVRATSSAGPPPDGRTG
jgi:secretion/DNA translocation related TadE-like protein